MLLFDGQVHYNTHVILMGNYVMTLRIRRSSPLIFAVSARQRRERLRLHAAASARLVPSHQALERDGAAVV